MSQTLHLDPCIAVDDVVEGLEERERGEEGRAREREGEGGEREEGEGGRGGREGTVRRRNEGTVVKKMVAVCEQTGMSTVNLEREKQT